MERVDEVLDFWFAELAPADWWSAAPEVDARVRVRFAALLDAMSAEPPDPRTLDARGHLAAVIVLDQFPRHLYRESARAFATDAAALGLALDAIDRGLDVSLAKPGRHFLYMPLMHAEDAVLQQRSVDLFAGLDDRDASRSALAHRKTFARFGRFPARNAALGRPSTDEERAFLAGRPGPKRRSR